MEKIFDISKLTTTVFGQSNTSEGRWREHFDGSIVSFHATLGCLVDHRSAATLLLLRSRFTYVNFNLFSLTISECVQAFHNSMH